MPNSPSTLRALAAVLRASPESDALVILGRLLDSLPIGFHVTDCQGAFLYANRVWERWLGPDKLPVAGKTLGELFPREVVQRVFQRVAITDDRVTDVDVYPVYAEALRCIGDPERI